MQYEGTGICLSTLGVYSPVPGYLTDFTGWTSNMLNRSANIATKFCLIELKKTKKPYVNLFDVKAVSLIPYSFYYSIKHVLHVLNSI